MEIDNVIGNLMEKKMKFSTSKFYR